MVPAGHQLILSCETFQMMEEHMFGESSQGSMTEALLFVAIVGLTLVSTIDLFVWAIKQEKNTDQEH
jgi:hypothetical protein